MSGAEKDAPEKSVQDFLQRWSRRKLGSAEAEDAAASASRAEEPPQTGESQLTVPPPAEARAESPAEFDLASLPPIDSIDAATDIRAFLAPGVPVELTRAALRRAWNSDPAIRDFIGIAENQWDFTNPDAVPGFGSLECTEEVRAMVSRLFGDAPETTGTSEPPECAQEKESMGTQQTRRAPSPLAGEGRGRGSGGDLQASTDVSRLATPTPNPSPQGGGEVHAAPQNAQGTEQRQPAQRKHGAALPK